MKREGKKLILSCNFANQLNLGCFFSWDLSKVPNAYFLYNSWNRWKLELLMVNQVDVL